MRYLPFRTAFELLGGRPGGTVVKLNLLRYAGLDQQRRQIFWNGCATGRHIAFIGSIV
ncbi:MAG: hypothetical protein ACK526_03330 [Planctomyces sp.]